MRIALVRQEAIDDTLRDAWRVLEARASQPANPFYCEWFLEPAMRHLAAPGSIRLLTIWDAHGALAGLAPVERGEIYAWLPMRHFATWRHCHAYSSAPLCAEGAAPAVYAAIFNWIDTHPDGACFMRFNEHPLHQGAVEFAQPSGRVVSVGIDIERAILSGGRPFETVYAQGFSGKKRKELRRQWCRLSETGDLRLERRTSPTDVARSVEEFAALELSGWKRDASGVSPIGASSAEFAFFRAAMRAGAERGAVFCDAVIFDGKPVAVLFSLRCGATLCAYKITYDEAFAAYSPGVHVVVEAMRLMLSEPSITLFDSCAKADHPLVDRLWRERMRVAQFDVSGSSRLDRALFGAASRLANVRRQMAARLTARRRTVEDENECSHTD